MTTPSLPAGVTVTPGGPATATGLDGHWHSFLAVVHRLIDHSHAYLDEQSKLSAHSAVREFGKTLLGDAVHGIVTRATDHAPTEDVRLRVPPSMNDIIPQNAPDIDYNFLAQLIAQQMRGSAAELTAGPVDATPMNPEITQ